MLVEAIGWIAAAFTLAAYSMRTMVPLRTAAIGANVAFAVYGWLVWSPAILTLHVILLPFNGYRLYEILRARRQIREARGRDSDFAWLRDLARPASYPDGTYVFHKGDRPDNLYYLDAGEVLLEEIDVTLGPGDIFGEIAFFTEAKERTVSARCKGACRILAIDEARFMSLYHQNPTFGFAIVQLIAKRLMDGIETRPEAYLSISAQAAAGNRPLPSSKTAR